MGLLTVRVCRTVSSLFILSIIVGHLGANAQLIRSRGNGRYSPKEKKTFNNGQYNSNDGANTVAYAGASAGSVQFGGQYSGQYNAQVGTQAGSGSSSFGGYGANLAINAAASAAQLAQNAALQAQQNARLYSGFGVGANTGAAISATASAGANAAATNANNLANAAASTITYQQQQEGITAQQDNSNLKYDDHIYFKSAFINSVKSFDEYWTDITKSRPLKLPGSRNSRRRDRTINLTFDFPLRGHVLRSIVVANGGFINLSGEGSAAAQYIAPLMADFDNRTNSKTDIKMYDDGKKFSAVWENLHLQGDSSKTFTFAITLYKTGEVIFAYKDIPMSVQNGGFSIGISDTNNENNENYNLEFNYPFSSGTLLKIIPSFSRASPNESNENETDEEQNNLIKPDLDLANLKYETYNVYKAAFVGNVEFFNQYWSGLYKVRPLQTVWTKGNDRYETIINLSFEFPFYNRFLQEITVTSEGYILLGKDSEYIAPLWSDFELPADINSAVKLFDDGDKFIVVWESLYLKADNTKAFSFAVIIFKTGEIVYLYKHIPAPIQSLYKEGYKIYFGFSNGEDKTQQVEFKNYDISSGTLFKILSLQVPKAANTNKPSQSQLFEKSSELISAEEDVSNLKYQTYDFYKTTLIGNLEYFNDYWVYLFKIQPLKKIWKRNAYRYETTVELSFEFLYFDQPLRNFVVTTGGYIIFGDDAVSGRALKHYIAPLAADFDDVSSAQKIKLYDDGEKFTVVWENVQLRTDKSKTFTFGTTLYKTGEIVFFYKLLPLSIQSLYELDKETKVGFADITDSVETSREIKFNNYDIATATLLKILAISKTNNAALTTGTSSAIGSSINTSGIRTSTNVDSNEPGKTSSLPSKIKLIRASKNAENLQYNNYDNYKTSLITNTEYFRNIWQGILTLKTQLQKVNWVKKTNYFEAIIELDFEFPFYGRKIQSITVTSAGFIKLGDDNQYIAPLNADFDENMFDPSSIRIFRGHEKYSIVWENLSLRADKTKLFSFALTLHKTGDIEFIYELISVTIQLLYERDDNVTVGISDLNEDENDETHKISFNNYDISSNSVLQILSLSPAITAPTTILTQTSTKPTDIVTHAVEPLDVTTSASIHQVQPFNSLEEKPKKLEKLVRAESNPEKLKYESYPSYKVGLLSNPEYFNNYWALILKSRPLQTHWTKKLNRYETDIELIFEFPFYGRFLQSITITSAGFIILSDDEVGLKQYIAPLMADFDENLLKYNSVILFQDEEKFSVIWDSLPLRSDKTKLFTFGVTLYKNGDITFTYKYISVTIQLLYEKDNNVKVGISDLIDDESEKTKEITFLNYDISNSSILKILYLTGAFTSAVPVYPTSTSDIAFTTTSKTYPVQSLEEPKKNNKLITGESNPSNLKYETYNLYKAGLITNPQYLNEIWLRITKSKPLKTTWTKIQNRHESVIELNFDFPLYGRILRSLRIASGGFIILGDEDLEFKQYIAPLMADFDETLFNSNSVKLYKDDNKFTVIWENLPLKSDRTKIFTFGVTLYNNGELEFIYKFMSITLELLYEIDNTAKVGISDFIDDESDETQTIIFDKFDISSNSVLKIKTVEPTTNAQEKKPISTTNLNKSPKPKKLLESTSFTPTTSRPYSNIHFVMAEEDSQNLKYVTHSFYKSSYVGNKPYYNDYWTEVKKTTPHKLLWKKSMHPYETDYELSFDFPFYDFIIRNITITSGGFILLGDHLQPDGAIVKQYIAPLMAEFDDIIFKEESIKFLDDGSKFIVLWENMYLQKDHEKSFTFAAILYKTGDIVFVYEDIPISIQTFYDNQQLVKVGISDDYLSDPSRWLTFMNYDIKSGTILKLLALFTPKTTPVPFVSSNISTTPTGNSLKSTEIEYYNEPNPTTTNVPFTNSPKLPISNQIRESPKLQLNGTTQKTLLDQNQLSEDIFKESLVSIIPNKLATFAPSGSEFMELSSPDRPTQEQTEFTSTELPPDLRFQFQSHYLYKSVMIKNPLYFEDHWKRITKSKLIKYTWHKSPYGYEATLDPSFDLPFYDIILPKITVNSAGFVNLVDYLLKDGIEVMQYIAPLKSTFDVTVVDEHTLKIYDDGEKLTFLWENIYLKDDKSKTFTFALTLYANGDIVFAYKHIPKPINTSDKQFDIGVSAAYINENNDFETKREIFFKNYVIESGTILAMIALPLVDENNTEQSSLNTSDSPFLQTMSPNLASLMNSITTSEPIKVTSIPTTSFTNFSTQTPNNSILSEKHMFGTSETSISESTISKLSATTPSSVPHESITSQSTYTTSYPLLSTLSSQTHQPNGNKPSTVVEEPFQFSQKSEDLKLPSNIFASSPTTSAPELEFNNDIPQKSNELVKPQTNTLNIIYTPQSYYQTALISNALYFEEYWTEIYQTKPVKKIWKQSTHGYETTFDLSFEFSLYGRVLRNITVTSNGFVDLGDNLENNVQQYISPLMTDYNDPTDKNVKFFESDGKFTIVWENLQLKTNKRKKFTFSLTLFSNGDIIFGYKDLPIPVQNLDNKVKVGISIHGTNVDDEQNYEMTFTNYDITPGSILKISTLPKPKPEDWEKKIQRDSLPSTSIQIEDSRPDYQTSENKYESSISSTTFSPNKTPLEYMDTSTFREKLFQPDDKVYTTEKTTSQRPTGETIKASQDLDALRYEIYGEYKVAFIGNLKYFNDHWSSITKSRPIRQPGRPGVRRNAKISFDFPFYGQTIRAITVSAEGFIDLNDNDAELPTHYIAPLMAKFDTKSINPTTLKFYDDSDKFTVVWENLHLEQDSEQTLTFAVTLFKTGEITFAYKNIPSLLELNDEYIIGVSDESNTIKLTNYDVASGTVLKLISKTQSEPTANVSEQVPDIPKTPSLPNKIRGRPLSSTTESPNSASEEAITKPATKLPGRRRPTKTTSTPNNNDKNENVAEEIKPTQSKLTLIKPADTIENIKYETYHLYKVALIGNSKFFNEQWLGSTKSRPIRQNEGSNTRRIWKLTFDFPFNGHVVRDIIINGEGYIDLSANTDENELPNIYIAPLFGKFDTKAIKPASIKIYDDGEKFTAVWENIYLIEDKTKSFTFAVTLYKNGDVVFAYKNIPKSLQQLFKSDNPIKIGLYDASATDEPFTLFFTNYEITSFNILKIVSLSNEAEEIPKPETSDPPKGRSRGKAASSTTELPSAVDLPNENISPSRIRPRINGLRQRISSTTESSSRSTSESQAPHDETFDLPSANEKVPVTERGRGRPKFNGLRPKPTILTESPKPENEETKEYKSDLPLTTTVEPTTTKDQRLRPPGRRQRPTTTSKAPLVEVTSEKLEFVESKANGTLKTPSLNDNESEITLETTTLQYDDMSTVALTKIAKSSTEIHKLHEESVTETESSKSTSSLEEKITTAPTTTTEQSKTSNEASSQKPETLEEVVEIKPKFTRPRISAFKAKFSTTTESTSSTVSEDNLEINKEASQSKEPISSTSEILKSEEPSSTSSSLPRRPGFRSSSVTRGKAPISTEKPENTQSYISSTISSSSTISTPESSSRSSGFRPRTSRPRTKTTETTSVLGDDEKLLQNTLEHPTDEKLESDQTPQTKHQTSSEIRESSVNDSPSKPNLSISSKNRGKFSLTTTEKILTEATELNQFDHQVTSELPETTTSELPSRPSLRLPSKNRFRTSTSTIVSVNPSEPTEQTPKLENQVTSEVPETSTNGQLSKLGLRLPLKNRFRTISSTTEKIYPSEVTETTPKLNQQVTSELPEILTSEQPSKTGLRLPSKNRFKVISSTTERANPSEVSEYSSERDAQITSELPEISTSEQPNRLSLRLPSKNRFKTITSTTEKAKPSKATEHSSEFEHEVSSELTEFSTTEQPSRPSLRLPSKNRFKTIQSTTGKNQISETTEQSSEFEHAVTSELSETLKKDKLIRPDLHLPSLNRVKITSITTEKSHAAEDIDQSGLPDYQVTSEIPETSSNGLPSRPGLRLPPRNRVKTTSSTEEPHATDNNENEHQNLRFPIKNRGKIMASTTEIPTSIEPTKKVSENIGGNRLTLKRPSITSLRAKITSTTETSDQVEPDGKTKIDDEKVHAQSQTAESEELHTKNIGSATSLLPKRPLPGRLSPSSSRDKITTTSTTQTPTSSSQKPISSFRNRATGGLVKVAPFRSKVEITAALEPEEAIHTETESEPNTEFEQSKKEIYSDDQEQETENKESGENVEPSTKSSLQKNPLPGVRAPSKVRVNLNAPNNKESIIESMGALQSTSKSEGSIKTATSGNLLKITGFRNRVTSNTESPRTETNKLSQESSSKPHPVESLESLSTLKRPLGNVRRPGVSQGKVTITTVTTDNDTPDLAVLASKIAKDASKFGPNVKISGIKTKVISTKEINPADNQEELDVEEQPTGTLQLDEHLEHIQEKDVSANSSPLSGSRIKITGLRHRVRPGKITLDTNDSDDAHEITSEELNPELNGDISSVSSDNTRLRGQAFKITRNKVTSENQQSEYDSSQNNGEVDSSEIIDASKLTNGAYVNKGRRIVGKFKVTGTPIGLQEFHTEGEVPEGFHDLIKIGEHSLHSTEGKDDGTLIGSSIATKTYKITGTAAAGSEQEFANLLKTKVIPDLVDATGKINDNLDSGVVSDENLNNQLNARSFVVQAQQPIVQGRRKKINYAG